jgi:hypothetical protein
VTIDFRELLAAAERDAGLAEAVVYVGDEIKRLAVGDDHGNMGPVEALAVALAGPGLATPVSDALSGIASAISEHAEAVERLAEAVEALTPRREEGAAG